jgi:tetratricopeptide (TPR) repeat protein
MPSSSSGHEPLSVILEAFEAYIHEASNARARNEQFASDLWVQAANRLLPAFGTVDDLLNHLCDNQGAEHAERIARALIVLQPGDALRHFQLGIVLQKSGRHRDSIAPYREALKIDPELHSLRNNLAAALLEEFPTSPEALALLEEATRRHPRDCNVWINLGKAYLAKLDLTRAIDAGEQGLRIEPDNPMLLANQGLRLREAQRWDDAEALSLKAHRLAPASSSYSWNLAMIHLLRGDYAKGWPEHEARWDGSKELKGRRPVLPKPRWQGEPLRGKTLLLWGEQGMGDLLQFCRFVPLLAERVHREGGRLTWNSFPQMGALLARSLAHHADEFTLGGPPESLPPFDYEISLLSLPLLFDTREETIPAPDAYLRADPGALARWRQRLSKEKRLKVGLVWTGSRGHQRNPFRRVGLERYVEYFRDIENVAFYSLQPGESAEVAAARTAGLDIADHTREFETFDDTAAYIGALDLVITVCTSVAHLSGALGQKTWLLLDVNPHWPWLLDRSDSPWYRSATLYRQKEFAQWEPVMARVTDDLKSLAVQRQSVEATE